MVKSTGSRSRLGASESGPSFVSALHGHQGEGGGGPRLSIAVSSSGRGSPRRGSSPVRSSLKHAGSPKGRAGGGGIGGGSAWHRLRQPPREQGRPRGPRRRWLVGSLAAAAGIWLLLAGVWMGKQMQKQAQTEAICAREAAAAVAAGGGPVPWFAEIAAERDDLQRRALLLQEQKVALLGQYNSSGTDSALAVTTVQLSHHVGLPRPFLFIAVLTTTSTVTRRSAVRHTWMQGAEEHGVMARFILTEEERNPALDEEQARYGDLIFLRKGSGAGYRSIVYKVFLALEWVVDNLDPNFVLKTDDDAYVDTAAMVAALRGLCLNADCRNERLYLGSEKRNGEVITDEANKWSNLEYFRLTGLREYAPYMMGGGYVFSGDVAEALVGAHAIAPLKFMPNEDATFGFWVMGMNLRHVDHPRAKTPAGHCCWGAVAPEDADGRWAPFRMRPYDRICAGWLILHKVDNTDQMRYIHERLKQCPEDSELERQAKELAAAQKRPFPVVGPLETAALTDWREGFHLFGYNDKSPWCADGSRMLALRTQLTPRELGIGDAAQVGVIPFAQGKPVSQDRAGWSWEALATTTAWNFQIGANAQWVGRSNRLAAFNSRACSPGDSQDVLCAVVMDVQSKRRLRVLPRPIFNISPDGTVATSLDFIRLGRTRRGFGYASSRQAGDDATRIKCPKDDGLWLMDMASGESSLLVSLWDLYEAVSEVGMFGGDSDPITGLPYKLIDRMPPQTLTDCWHWINHPQFNAEGTEIVFLYRIGKCPRFYGEYFRTYVFTVAVDGTFLWRLPLIEGAFHDFGAHGRLLISDKDGHTLFHVRQNATRLAPPPAVAALGFMQPTPFGGDTRAVALASQGDPQSLVIWDTVRNDSLAIGYFSPKDWDAPEFAKGGLRPRWSPCGRYLAFDSAHMWGTGSQMYVTGVQLAAVPPAVVTHASFDRKIMVDLAVRAGATLSNFAAGQLHDSLPPVDVFTHVHAFQAGALSDRARGALDRLVARLKLTADFNLHSEAAYTHASPIIVNTAGRNRSDVPLDELSTMLLAADSGVSPESDGRWAPWRVAGADHPPPSAGGNATMEFGHEGLDVEVPAVDMAAWLRDNVQAMDDVTVVMDVGGREGVLLRHLLKTRTLPLIDRLLVHWHPQHLTWEEPLLWAGLCSAVGVQLEALPRPEDVAAARRAAAIRPMKGVAVLDPRHAIQGFVGLNSAFGNTLTSICA